MPYEDRLTLALPEGVTIDVTLAGAGSRIMAATIDALIQLVVVVALVVVLVVASDDAAAPTGDPFSGATENEIILLGFAVINVVAFLVFFFYYVLFETLSGGSSPGKRVAGLRVVSVGGEPIGFRASAIRNLLRLVDILPLSYGVGLVSILVSPRNQRIGDIVAGTIVIRDQKLRDARTRKRWIRRTRPQPAAPRSPVYLDAELASWDVAAVTPDELSAVRQFLLRRNELGKVFRDNIANDLATRLRPKVAGAGAENAETFLEKLAAAKSARE